MKSVLKTVLSLTLPLLAAHPGMAEAKGSRASTVLSVKWTPSSLVNGSPCLFRVRPAKTLKSLTGFWLSRRVFFHFDAETRTWYGLAGVGIDTASGKHQLKLVAKLANGARVSSSHSITIGKTAHRTIDLSVPTSFTEPDAEALARIIQERALKRELFSHITENRLWSGRFIPPVRNVITEEFGTERTFTGVRESVHQGLDYRAHIGTPVAAMNSGRVLIARALFYEGGFVVIDHGCGLATLYMHLSGIKVKEGDRVRRRQIVGYSGATGRVTGPHLHVGVRWQGIYVDPAALLGINLN
jgi:murein DD-endopeptidase MepM/ murein hydrolase activator NlpD